MSSVRLRRLEADFQRLQDFARCHPRVELIKAEGTPPERYRLRYHIRSLKKQDGRLVEAGTHLVEIALPRDYPRVPPQCRMLTPVFHPNIAPHAICIGDHWSAGEPLAAIVARIGELLAYQSYNIKSPLNGEAARWTSENLGRLPLDSVGMLFEAGPDEAAPTKKGLDP
jgi:ubiquitin-protein ligase